MTARPFTAIGIDVGGTKIAAGVVRFPEGRILTQRIISTAPARGGEAVLDDVAALATELAVGQSIQGVGLGVCELVGPDGRILSANSIDWTDQPLAERLSSVGPLVIEADVRAAALAEARFGAGRPYRVFAYVTVGTGISNCLVIDGVPFVGARGATGTMASSPMSFSCEHCHQVSRRALEDFASGLAIVARFDRLRPGVARNALDVFAAAAAGDNDALEVAHSAGEDLGSMIGLLVNILDPEAVVIGGGLGLSEGAYTESLVSSIRRHIWSEVHRDLPILRASTGDAAGMLGAAAAAWNALQTSPSRSTLSNREIER